MTPRPTTPCPDALVCQSCPCAGEDDVCFPEERARQDAYLQVVDQRNRLVGTLIILIRDVERDRREPDKILCHVASAKRRMFDAEATD